MTTPDRTVHLDDNQATAVAHLLLAERLARWELSWEDLPYLDDESMDLVTEACSDIVADVMERHREMAVTFDVDAVDLFDQAQP